MCVGACVHVYMYGSAKRMARACVRAQCDCVCRCVCECVHVCACCLRFRELMNR